jgi:hypothetical protein
LPRRCVCKISPAQTVFVAAATARQTSGVGKLAASFNAWANRQSPSNTEISLPQFAARRRTAPAHGRFVHHVVVHERRQMHHLDNHRDRDVAVLNSPVALAARPTRAGTQLLALRAQSVFGVTGEIRLERG